MFNIKNVEIFTEQLSIKNTYKMRGNYEMHPEVARDLGVENEAEHKYYTALKFRIKGTEIHPFPIDLKVSLRAVFELELKDGCERKHIERFLRQQGVHILYPYVRAAVASLTSAANIPVITLQVINALTLFAEDEKWVYENFEKKD